MIRSSMSRRLPAMVHSWTGWEICPFSTQKPERPARIVARRRVDRRPDHRGDQKPGAHLRHQVVAAGSALRQVDVRRCGRGRAPSPARGVGGAGHPQLAPGRKVQHPAGQHAVLDDRAAAGRQPLAVEGARGDDARAVRVFDQRQARRAGPACPAGRAPSLTPRAMELPLIADSRWPISEDATRSS